MIKILIVFMVMWPIITIGLYVGHVEWAIAIAIMTGIFVGSKY